MKCVIDSNIILSRAPEGPVAAYIGQFAKSLREQGYAAQSIHRQVLLAASFSGWLARRQIVLRDISSSHVPQYLRYRLRHVRPSHGDVAALKHLLEFLRCGGAIPCEEITNHPTTPAERCARNYEQYLREARGLSRATIINYVPCVRSFLKLVPAAGVA